MHNHKLLCRQKSGFALMMSLIVVSVVISVGLTLLDVSLKQVRLSTNSRDSEIALHAASAGLECAQYWRAINLVDMENGDPISPTCFGSTVLPATVTPSDESSIITSGSGSVYLYDYQVTWGSGMNTRCSDMSVLLINADLSADVSVTGLVSLLNGYPTNTKTCPAGGKCTILSTRGYSKGCSSIGTAGTVEREVLLEL